MEADVYPKYPHFQLVKYMNGLKFSVLKKVCYMNSLLFRGCLCLKNTIFKLYLRVFELQFVDIS